MSGLSHAAVSAAVIHELVTPAVMISACGLLCLSTNARMMSVIGRIRTLHAERVAAYIDEPGENPRKKHARAVKLEGLAWQSKHMLRRLNLMRLSMLALFASILAMLGCSACLGVATLLDQAAGGRAASAAGLAATVCFVAGGAAMALAMLFSFHEMRVGLRAVTYEHERVLQLSEDTPVD